MTKISFENTQAQAICDRVLNRTESEAGEQKAKEMFDLAAGFDDQNKTLNEAEARAVEKALEKHDKGLLKSLNIEYVRYDDSEIDFAFMEIADESKRIKIENKNSKNKNHLKEIKSDLEWVASLAKLLLLNDSTMPYFCKRIMKAKTEILKAGFEKEKTYKLIRAILETGNTNVLLLPPDNLIQAIIKLKKLGVGDETILNILAETMETVDMYSGYAFEALPGLIELGKSNKEIIELFRKISNSEIYNIGHTLSVLPDYIGEGLTHAEIIEFVKGAEKIIPKTFQDYSEGSPYATFPKYIKVLRTKDLQLLKSRIKSFKPVLSLGKGNMSAFLDFLFHIKLEPRKYKNKIDLSKAITLQLNKAIQNQKHTQEKLERLCQHSAISINTIHDNDPGDTIRKNIAKNLSPEAAYYLIALGGADLYTSSFLLIWDNLKKIDLIKFIQEVDPQNKYLGDFILTLSSFNRFTNLFDQNPDFFLGKISELFMKEKELPGIVSSLTESIGVILEKQQHCEKIETILIKFYNKYKKEGKNIARGAIGFLIKLYADRLSNKAKDIARSLPEPLTPQIPREKWLKDGLLTAKLYFHTKSYVTTIEKYKSLGFKVERKEKDDWLLIKKINGISLKVIITKDTTDVDESLHDPNIDIIAHRGHSFDLKHTFNPQIDAKNQQKLLYLGSCGSFRAIPDLMENYHGNYFVADQDQGVGTINNIALYHLMLSIARGTKDWKKIKESSHLEKEGLVYPGDKSLLIIDYLQNFK